MGEGAVWPILSGGLYTSGMRYDRGYFRGRRAVCCVTAGAPAVNFCHNGRGGDIHLLLWPMHYSLYYMGYSVLPPYLALGIQGHGYAYAGETAFRDQLEALKDGWAARLEGLASDEPIRFPGWDDWDESGVLKPGIEGYDYFIRARP